MRKTAILLAFFLLFLKPGSTVYAQKASPPASSLSGSLKTATPIGEDLAASDSAELSTNETPSPTPTPEPTPRVDITQTSEVTMGRFERLLEEQELGPALPFNPVKYAIRASVDSGVPPNTIILLLLLPLVVALIAAARHVVGLRGFGIFLPASLAIVFVATGPVVGIGLFLVIVLVSTFARILLRRLKIKLQYLPRMALILWMTVGGVLLTLFLAPAIGHSDFTNVSIFPVLILVLLAEDFSKVQLGKSARTAVMLATETIILALVSYAFLTMETIQEFALLHPELLLLGVVLFDVLLGRYIGLRFLEYWRYRKLILQDR